ncbi:MAG: hypothetical protein K2X99_02690 [Gemmatimonadaceae bacterium]|nr:hypothetical protein [Gemmatimonadaceae bacterium]
MSLADEDRVQMADITASRALPTEFVRRAQAIVVSAAGLAIARSVRAST